MKVTVYIDNEAGQALIQDTHIDASDVRSAHINGKLQLAGVRVDPVEVA
jgi:hypothetical protein